MFAVYKQIHSPTTLEMCVRSDDFTGTGTCNLIVVKSSLLEIYTLRENVQSNAKVGTKLFLYGRYPLFGTVLAMCAGRFAGNTRDSLFLCFEGSKLAILDFDLATNDLVTVSMLSYEHLLEAGGKFTQTHRPLLACDPQNRCVVFPVSETKMLVFPLLKDNRTFLRGQGKLVAHRDAELADHNPGVEAKERTHYLIDISALGVRQMKDLIFLHGYDEPSLLILHQPIYTWSGRTAVCDKACELLAISLNISQKGHSVICRSPDLPHDCFSLIQAPASQGGALIVGPSHILYYSLRISFGLSLNEFGTTTVANDIVLDESSEIANLDRSQCSFLSPSEVMVSGKDGDLYLLKLLPKSMEFVKIGSSVPPSCMLTLSKQHLFIGSRLGDSVLVRFLKSGAVTTDGAKEKEAETPNGKEEEKLKGTQEEEDDNLEEFLFGDDDEDEEPTAKRRKVAESVTDMENLDELVAGDDLEAALFGTVKKAGKNGASAARQWDYSVVDSLANIGPVTDVCFSQVEPSGEDPDEEKENQTYLDMVLCSGRGKSGGLNVIHEGIRVDVITDLNLNQETFGCWTVFEDDDADESTSSEVDPFHAYLLISQQNKTLVLSTQEELQQVTDTGFYTEGLTILCGHILGRTRTVQVYEHGVRLLKNGEDLQDVPVESPIAEAGLVDPYLVVRLTDGQVRLLTASTEDGLLHMTTPELMDQEEAGVVTAMCVFRDTLGDRAFQVHAREPRPASDDDSEGDAMFKFKKEEPLEAEDAALEAMLFGDVGMVSDDDVREVRAFERVSNGVKRKKNAPGKADEVSLCVVTRDNGRLEMYALPSFTRVYASPRISFGARLLKNFLTRSELEAHESVSDVRCEEICMARLGKDTKTFVLAFLTNGDLLVYEVFYFDPCPKHPEEDYIPMRLSKVSHGLITRPLVRRGTDYEPVLCVWRGGRRFVPFANIAGRSGIFIGGRRPAWAFGERGFFRLHEMTTRRGVSSLTPFHNVNCARGLVLFDMAGMLQIASLPGPNQLNLDADLPFRKVHIRQSSHNLVQHATTKGVVVVLSKQVDAMGLVMPTERSLKITAAQFSLHLYDSTTWRLVDQYDGFEENEHVACVAQGFVNVVKEGQTRTKKNYVVCGTGLQRGEDSACKGRVYLFEVSARRRERTLQLVRLFDEEQRGPIASASMVDGLVLLAVGPKLMLFYWNGSELVCCAFYDSQFFSVSVSTLKNYVLMCDAYRSVQLLLWEKNTKQLIQLGKDTHWLSCYSGDFLVDDEQMSTIVSDAQRNVQFLVYDPHRPDSRGGKKLLPMAGFHVGAFIEKFARLKARDVNKRINQRLISFAGTSIGSLVYFCPIDKDIYLRLNTLFQQMTFGVEHYAGQNPRAFRKFRAPDKDNRPLVKRIVDGELLKRFLDLNVVQQKKLARYIGSKPEQIIDNLLQLNLMTRFF
eukprot:162286_1